MKNKINEKGFGDITQSKPSEDFKDYFGENPESKRRRHKGEIEDVKHKNWVRLYKSVPFFVVLAMIVLLVVFFVVFPMSEIEGDGIRAYSYALRPFVEPAWIALLTITVTKLLEWLFRIAQKRIKEHEDE